MVKIKGRVAHSSIYSSSKSIPSAFQEQQVATQSRQAVVEGLKMSRMMTRNYYSSLLEKEEDDCAEALIRLMVNDPVMKEMSEGKKSWGDILFDTDREVYMKASPFNWTLNETDYEMPVYRVGPKPTETPRRKYEDSDSEESEESKEEDRGCRRFDGLCEDDSDSDSDNDSDSEDEFEEDYQSFDWTNVVWEKVPMRDYDEDDKKPYRNNNNRDKSRYAFAEKTEAPVAPVSPFVTPPQLPPRSPLLARANAVVTGGSGVVGAVGAVGAEETTMPTIPEGRCTLIVRNLPRNTTVQDLRMKFDKYGVIRDIYLPKNMDRTSPYFGTLKGFALIKYLKPTSAQDAFKQLYGKLTIGRNNITVDFAKEDR